MLNAVLKSSVVLRAQQTLFTTPPISNINLPARIGGNTSRVRFLQQAVPGPNQPDKKSMEQNPKPTSKTGDTMSSFGEGYATRSDEEGFGGTHGGNQYLNKNDEEKIKDGKSSENDSSQGSEVKEKETSRNQK